MSKSSLSLKGSMDPQSLAQLLEDMAASIKAGTVCLQKGGEFVTLKPCGPMEFTIEAAIKKGRQKLEISMKWEEPAEVAAPGDITISAVEPEPAACEPETAEVTEAPCETQPAPEPEVEAAAPAPGSEEKQNKKGKKK